MFKKKQHLKEALVGKEKQETLLYKQTEIRK